MKSTELQITKEDIIYSKIGAALVSAQRVEFITGQILELLQEHGAVYGITTSDFISDSEKSKKLRKKTLGQIFKSLQLNPTLVITDELNEYSRLRNILVHHFYQTHLNSKSDEQMWRVIEFCYSFGRYSNRMETFFKGFLYFLSLRHVKDREQLPTEIQQLNDSFDYFIKSLKEMRLQGIEDEIIYEFKV